MEKEITLVYMAAGMSSRFGGKIKAFAKVGSRGETLIEYSLDQALPAGFSKIVFIVGPATEGPFKDLFGDSYKGVPVQYALQSFDPETRDRPWGTGQAITILGGITQNGFVVANSDDIYGAKAYKVLCDHLREKESAALVGYKLSENLSEKGTSNRGVIRFSPDRKVESIKEVLNIDPKNLGEKNLKPDDLVSMNLFALPSSIVPKMKSRFLEFEEEHREDRRVEFFLPAELSDMIKKGEIEMLVYDSPERTIGLTYPEDEEIVRKKLELISSL